MNLIHCTRFVPIVSLPLFCLPVGAEPVIAVVHPKIKLVPGDIEMKRGEITDAHPALAAFTKAKPQVVVGKSAKDAPDGNAFILELEDPKTYSVPKVLTGGDPKVKFKTATLSYKDQIAVEPFTVWHRNAAGAEPELLGRGFVWGEESPLTGERVGDYTYYWLSGETPEQLIAKAVKKNAVEIPELLSHALAEKLIASQGKPNFTSEAVFAYAKQIPVKSAPPPIVKEGGRFKLDMKSGALKKPPDSAHWKMVFRPSRVVKDADGGVVIEVDMWNRLPARTFGMLHYEQNQAIRGLEEVARKKGVSSNKILKEVPRFDLAPGEKTTVPLRIRKEASTDPALVRDIEITLELVAVGEMVDIWYAAHPNIKAKMRKKN